MIFILDIQNINIHNINIFRYNIKEIIKINEFNLKISKNFLNIAYEK